MIGGVGASLVTLTNARHWYNLVRLEKCDLDKTERFVLVPMVRWFLQLCMWLLQTVKCPNMAPPTQHFVPGSEIFLPLLNKKISQSPEFGPVT